jgi:hypothetical protein
VASVQLSGLQQGGLSAIVSELAQEAIPTDTDAVVPGADAVNLEDLLSDDDDDLPEIQDSEPTQTYALPSLSFLATLPVAPACIGLTTKVTSFGKP